MLLTIMFNWIVSVYAIRSHNNLRFKKDWVVNQSNSLSSIRKITYFIFVCLVNKSSSGSSLSITTKKVKLKHNNVLVADPARWQKVS